VLRRALAPQDNPEAARELGWLDHPAAAAALVERCRVAPSEALVEALGWGRSQAAVDALSVAAEDRALRAAALAALEKSPAPGATDALAGWAERGERWAIRALARRRDARARPHLLALLQGPEDLLAVDGLRDLRDPTTAELLLGVVQSSPDPDVRAVAAHALVSQQAPELGEAVLLLATDPDPDLRRLAGLWLA
jgi:HEAT repeat protein